MALISKRTLRFALGAVVLLALLALSYEVAHWYVHVYASGARIQTELTSMASRVDGTIEQILVEEGARVKAGQTLVQLEDDDIELEIQALQTDLELEQARRARLDSQMRAFNSALRSRLGTKREEIAAARVALQAIKDRLQLAERDLERTTVLYRKDLSSARDFSAEQDKMLVLKGEAARAQAAIEVAERELEQVQAGVGQLQVFHDQILESEINSMRIRKTIDSARVALGHRQIKSPIDALIDRIYKHKGEYVEEGDRVLILHDEKLLWLEASIDEGKIRHVRVGQSVDIHLQVQPYAAYRGEVVQIGSATSLEMGIGDQRGGQFGRRAEHLPIRIKLHDPPENLAPGMLARINIRRFEALPLPSLFHLFKRRESR